MKKLPMKKLKAEMLHQSMTVQFKMMLLLQTKTLIKTTLSQSHKLKKLKLKMTSPSIKKMPTKRSKISTNSKCRCSNNKCKSKCKTKIKTKKFKTIWEMTRKTNRSSQTHNLQKYQKMERTSMLSTKLELILKELNSFNKTSTLMSLTSSSSTQRKKLKTSNASLICLIKIRQEL